MYISMYLCMYVFEYICMYMCMYLCMYKYCNVYKHKYTHIDKHTDDMSTFILYTALAIYFLPCKSQSLKYVTFTKSASGIQYIIRPLASTCHVIHSQPSRTICMMNNAWALSILICIWINECCFRLRFCTVKSTQDLSSDYMQAI